MILKQPSWTRFAPRGLVLNVATLGPVGRFPAPGTWGSLAGLIWFTVVLMPLGPFGALLVTAGGLYLAFAFCGEAEVRMQKVDPQEVVLDEFACVPIVMLGSWDQLATPEAWVVFLLAFGLFRLFDVVKPFGIRDLQRFHGGLGVLLDDFAAAIASMVTLQILTRLTPLLEWLRGGG
ncbi:MAG TPA: phosphatidylglycerophosphatase A [Opitutaceae bacterium]